MLHQTGQKFIRLAKQQSRFQSLHFLVLLLHLLEGFHGAVVFLVDLCGEEGHVGEPDCGGVGQVLQDGLAFLDEGAFLHVGQQHDLFQFLDGELVGDVEAADAVHLVTEEFDAVGVVVGKRKHVDQAATDGELPRLHHEIDVLELVFVEQVGEEIEVHLVAHLDLEGVLGQQLAGEYLFAQCFGVAHYQGLAFRGGDALQHLCPRKDIGVVGLLRLVGAFVGSGVEEDLFLAVVHAALAEEAFEVVVEIGRVFLVGAYDEMNATHLAEGLFHDEGLRRGH